MIKLQNPGAKRNQKYDLGSRSVLYPDVSGLKNQALLLAFYFRQYVLHGSLAFIDEDDDSFGFFARLEPQQN